MRRSSLILAPPLQRFRPLLERVPSALAASFHPLTSTKSLKKVSRKQYRLTVDVIDPEGEHWDYGDCRLQVDLWDEPSHRAQMRGPLATAFDLYRLAPKEPPTGVEAKLLWDIGEAVNGFVDRIFAAGIVCPFTAEATTDTPERAQ
jgi:hypothetical protein